MFSGARRFFGGGQSIQTDSPRAPPVAAGSGAAFTTEDRVQDTLKHISEDGGSKKSIIDIATQILETSDDAAAPAEASASASDSGDDKVREFLNKVKSNPEYIRLLKDITKSTIEQIASQSSLKDRAYSLSISRARSRSQWRAAKGYAMNARTYFKSIGDEDLADKFERIINEERSRAEARPTYSASGPRTSRKTRRKGRRGNKKTRKNKK